MTASPPACTRAASAAPGRQDGLYWPAGAASRAARSASSSRRRPRKGCAAAAAASAVAVPRLLLPHPRGPGRGGAGRRRRVRRRRRDDGRLRARRLAGALRRLRRHDLRRQPDGVAHEKDLGPPPTSPKSPATTPTPPGPPCPDRCDGVSGADRRVRKAGACRGPVVVGLSLPAAGAEMCWMPAGYASRGARAAAPAPTDPLGRDTPLRHGALGFLNAEGTQRPRSPPRTRTPNVKSA